MGNNTGLYIDIFNALRTDGDVNRCLEDIDTAVKVLYTVTGHPFEQQVRDIFAPHIADAILVYLESRHVALTDTDACREALVALGEELRRAETVELTLAVQPDSALMTQMSNYIREIFSRQEIILAVKVNEQIIGGAEIIRKGSYRDLSLNKRIDEWFTRDKNGAL